MKEFAGRVTVVLTPELRQLAVKFVQEGEVSHDAEILNAWFDVRETPDGFVIDAACSEAEALMIVTIAKAIHSKYE